MVNRKEGIIVPSPNGVNCQHDEQNGESAKMFSTKAHAKCLLAAAQYLLRYLFFHNRLWAVEFDSSYYMDPFA
jgi:hypothetical protein